MLICLFLNFNILTYSSATQNNCYFQIIIMHLLFYKYSYVFTISFRGFYTDTSLSSFQQIQQCLIFQDLSTGLWKNILKEESQVYNSLFLQIRLAIMKHINVHASETRTHARYLAEKTETQWAISALNSCIFSHWNQICSVFSE